MNVLDHDKAMRLIKKNKLPYANSNVVKNVEQAVKFSKKIGYPVVIKALSKHIVHKSDLNAVKKDIKDEEELRKEFDKLLSDVKKKLKGKRVEGVEVQEMVKGKEVIIGMKKDDIFGNVVMFGLGGIFVEILKDVVFRMPPIDKDEAINMIEDIKAYKILQGARGQKTVNIEKLAEIIVKVSKIAEEGKISEIDLNPVIVNEKEAKIVDFRAVK